MEFRTNDHIESIRKEYRRIDGKWLRLHYRLMMYMAAVAVAAEIVMFFILSQMGKIEISPAGYAVKYLLIPLGCNLLLCAVSTMTVRSSHMSDRRKAYAMSLLMAVMAFVLYTAHSVFYALFLVFTIPVLFTIVYADQVLTGGVSLVCLAEKLICDLFITWDPAENYPLETGDSRVNFGVSLLLLVLFYTVCGVLIRIEREKNEASIKLEQERQRYRAESITDALTGVANRKALRDAFREMEEQEQDVFFLAMLDLDDFKSLNDTYGHSCGDAYLKSLGMVLRENATEQAAPFRFGGDEFCVLFRDCLPETVCAICRQIQAEFCEAEIHRSCQTVSVSIGVAKYRQGELPTQLLDRADAALYRAKKEKGSLCFE